MHEIMLAKTDELTFENVVGFCSRGIPENLRLEYKREFSAKRRGRQSAKQVAAFANTQGGTIIFGVHADEKQRKPAPNQMGNDLGNDPREAVLQACSEHIYPTPYFEVSDFLRNPDDPSRGFLVVTVAPGRDVPYAIDQETRIYVRVSDQSTPVAATVQQIRLLIERRTEAMSRQQGRRDIAFDRLSAALAPLRERQGELWVSIGPELDAGPIFDDVRQLREQSTRFSIWSECAGATLPIQESRDTKALLDGIYTLNPSLTSAVTYDLFGNITLFQNMAVDYPARTDSAECLNSDHAPDTGGFPRVVLAPNLAHWVLVAFEVASRMYTDRRFLGPLSVRIRVIGVQSMRLLVQKRLGPVELGSCPLDQKIEITDTLNAEHVVRDPSGVVTSMFDRLLWAWGCTKEDITVRILERGAMLLHGSDRCRCERLKPKNEEKCRECRQRAKL